MLPPNYKGSKRKIVHRTDVGNVISDQLRVRLSERNVTMKSPETIERYLQVKQKCDIFFLALSALFDSLCAKDPEHAEEHRRYERQCKDIILDKGADFIMSYL